MTVARRRARSLDGRPPSAPRPRAVVLLRAVNVGGHVLPMTTFRSVLREVVGSEPTTVGASGNAVVELTPGRDVATWEHTIAHALERALGWEADVFVRPAEMWERLVAGNPFPSEARSDPAHLVLATLSAAPTESAWKALDRAIVGRERVRPGERAAYIVYPDGIGRSKLTTAVIERSLGVRSTSRNWNTALALLRLLASTP